MVVPLVQPRCDERSVPRLRKANTYAAKSRKQTTTPIESPILHPLLQTPNMPTTAPNSNGQIRRKTPMISRSGGAWKAVFGRREIEAPIITTAIIEIRAAACTGMSLYTTAMEAAMTSRALINVTIVNVLRILFICTLHSLSLLSRALLSIPGQGSAGCRSRQP